MLKIEKAVGKTSCFLYTKHDRRRDAGGPENALRGQKRRGRVRFLRTHNGERVKGAGGFNVRKGTAARSFQTMNVVWAERFRTGKACGYRFMDTCRGGASASQCHQMAVSLTGGAQWRRICRVPAMGSQRRGAAKAAGLQRSRSLSWYRNPEIRKDSPW